MNTKHDNKSAVVLLSAFLILSASFSLLYLLVSSPGSAAGHGYTAEIYQDGRLLYSIPLNDISDSQTIIIKNLEGGINEIEIRPGSIGIISADCPDRLCVRQGFITDAKLPITCLPNRLVVLLRPVPDETGSNSITPDILTY